ncbi:hypothetical protein P3T34_004850 [Kitasatospora sp. MAP12-44]|uniref:hypothetical protein n=1 Tax=Kitasatospora sp. MAP12-44 TaxID=3035099 RepID=UPI0024733668|nr:hypothetical protein [Kitasatospora sp. MAP12-44]MDH6112635.1 hypothetical protein [Kitasatospora sp. MAP12-44]
MTVLRITTGGIGREPGMLIEIRVVSVVSVFGTSGSAAPAAPWKVSPPVPGAPVPKPFATPGVP